MTPPNAPMPRSRHEIELEWTRALERAHDGKNATALETTTMMLLVELLCDVRDFVSECAVRLSDIEAQSRAQGR